MQMGLNIRLLALSDVARVSIPLAPHVQLDFTELRSKIWHTLWTMVLESFFFKLPLGYTNEFGRWTWNNLVASWQEGLAFANSELRVYSFCPLDLLASDLLLSRLISLRLNKYNNSFAFHFRRLIKAYQKTLHLAIY